MAQLGFLSQACFNINTMTESISGESLDSSSDRVKTPLGSTALLRSGLFGPTHEPTGADLLTELVPTVEANLNRHLAQGQMWYPHEYIPWGDGRNFAALGGEDWNPSQSKLDDTAKAAMILNLLTEDNLPSYHREIAVQFGLDNPWGQWVGRWTAEENRHGTVMRDYLHATRAVDPVALEDVRMSHMVHGYQSDGRNSLQTLAYVSFQELATRVSHRNTGTATQDPIAERMMQRVSKDENLHMIFYRNLVSAALDVAPNQTMRAITDEVVNFQMPGSGMANFGRMAAVIAKGRIYDPRSHYEEVVLPVVKFWGVMDRSDFSGDGEQARDQLAGFLAELALRADKFDEQMARLADRKAKNT